jgi:hypothetical protein
VDWTKAGNSDHHLVDGEGGRWVQESFTVNCAGSKNDKMFLDTYVTAYVGNSKHEPACQGGYLIIENHHPSYPAFFGLSGVINQSLKPRQSQTLPLAIYRSKNDAAATIVEVYLRYWKEQ